MEEDALVTLFNVVFRVRFANEMLDTARGIAEQVPFQANQVGVVTKQSALESAPVQVRPTGHVAQHRLGDGPAPPGPSLQTHHGPNGIGKDFAICIAKLLLPSTQGL
jgi:hypothetical protein